MYTQLIVTTGYEKAVTCVCVCVSSRQTDWASWWRAALRSRKPAEQKEAHEPHQKQMGRCGCCLSASTHCSCRASGAVQSKRAAVQLHPKRCVVLQQSGTARSTHGRGWASVSGVRFKLEAEQILCVCLPEVDIFIVTVARCLPGQLYFFLFVSRCLADTWVLCTVSITLVDIMFTSGLESYLCAAFNCPTKVAFGQKHILQGDMKEELKCLVPRFLLFT